jgi:dTDP-4-amino-4,6-dideoxygalactose transaminase
MVVQSLQTVSDLTLPTVPEWAEVVWHLFVVRSKKRDELMAQLDSNGVKTLIHYPIPPHLSGAYASLNFSKNDFPLTSQLSTEILSLPMGIHITDQHVKKVADILQMITA